MNLYLFAMMKLQMAYRKDKCQILKILLVFNKHIGIASNKFLVRCSWFKTKVYCNLLIGIFLNYENIFILFTIVFMA